MQENLKQSQLLRQREIEKINEEIFKLKERIDTMSSDFAKMLKTTLRKMQERIDDANQTYEADQPGLGAEGAAGFPGSAAGNFGLDDGMSPGI